METEREHLYLAEILRWLKFYGIWPSRTLKRIHGVYGNFMLLYFSLFITTQVVELFHIEDQTEIMENLALTLLYFLSWGKIMVSKSRRIKLLVDEIYSYEREIIQETFKNLYSDMVKYYHKLNIFLMIVGITTTVPFFVRPVLEDLLNPQNPPYELLNSTMVYKKRPLPLSSWFPYDKYKYYYTSFALQVIAVTYAASCLVLTDGFLLGLMVFLAGRIKILHERLKNLKNPQLNSDDESTVMRTCALEHQNVIRSVKLLDLSMKLLMFLDFVICSMQIAISAFWVIVTTPSIQLGVVLIYFIAMIIQLFLFYGFANNVTFESTEICSAIWNSEWYECSEPVKRSLLLVLLRSQKPLTLMVGPFYAMSNPMALAILKSAYSYVALLSKTYNHKQ